jgi:hypothetical protein
MTGKKRVITEEQYEKITYWARRLITQDIIAEVGFTENYNEGKVGLYVASYRKSVDRTPGPILTGWLPGEKATVYVTSISAASERSMPSSKAKCPKR